MGIGHRFYFVEDDDTIHRFPFSRYEKLIRGGSKERIPKYAGKRIRCAFMTLQLEGRKPHRILRSEYPILTFDADGKFDSDTFEEEVRLDLIESSSRCARPVSGPARCESRRRRALLREPVRRLTDRNTTRPSRARRASRKA